jgi:cytochrome c553
MHNHVNRLAAAVGVWGLGFVTAWAAAPSAGELQFNRDIRPILSENCLHCHGPDARARQANLRLDTEEGLFGKDGAVARGRPSESPLYQRIAAQDETELMPPPDSRKQLTVAQKELLKKWIEQGAPWQGHWSFVPPQRAPLPPVKNAAWVRNPIDAFVLARLEAAGLSPAPEADRRTVARRLSLDLTGLPPAPADMELFVADTGADAYGKFIARLLESPHWGEHRGRYWLDGARYADTHGIHFDNFREVWAYRDWVIDAFNRNLPFDQFTIEQLAGDLLPNPTLDQLVATGFNRCHITTNEGGVIGEEYLVLYARDRTETTSQVWLGLTANCSVCHDHKFDRLTQRDFYSLAAFFNNTTQHAMDGNIKNTPPVLFVPRTADRPRWQTLARDVAEAKQLVEMRTQAARPEFDKFLSGPVSQPLADRTLTQGLHLHAPLSEGAGSAVKVTVDGKLREMPLTGGHRWEVGHTAPQALRVGTGGSLAVAEAGDFDTRQAFSFGAWVKLTKPAANGAVFARLDNEHDYRGWDLWLEQDRVGTHIIHRWPDDALKVVSRNPLKVGDWTHVFVSYDGSARAAGVRVYVNGQLQPGEVAADKLQNTIRTTVPWKLAQRHSTQRLDDVVLQDVRLYSRALTETDVGRLAKSSRLETLLAKARQTPPAVTDAEKNELYSWWLVTRDKLFQDASARVAALEQEQASLKARGTEAYVMQERGEPATAFILFRGSRFGIRVSTSV